MKNQFFGDSRDLFKFHLVLHAMVSLQFKTFTYVPLLTLNDDSGQGGLTDYSRPPCHENLYEFLQLAVVKNRDIRSLRDFFANKPFRYHPFKDDAEFKESERDAYFREIPGEVLQDALILLDPDTGLEVDQKSGPKYLRYEELRGLFGRMGEKSALMVFQFFFFTNDARIEKVRTRICSELPEALVTEGRHGQVAFFFLAKDKQVLATLQRMVADYPVEQKPSTSGTAELKHRELTEKIIGIFYDVYNELGHGFLESVYQSAMEIALKDAGLRVEREVAIPVWFRSRDVGNFKADLLVEGCVLLELKTAQAIDRAHEAQLMNYLRATEIEVGLLFNFGPKPQFRRIVFENERKKIRVHPRESAVEAS